MNIKEFEVEKWMTDHEGDAKYNLTDTCIDAMTLKQLEELTNVPIMNTIQSIRFDYGPITGSDELKKAILTLYKSGDTENITITNGASSANELVMLTLLNSGDHVIALTPSYQQFYSFPESLGCTYDLIETKEENNWLPTIDDFKNNINEHTKMIILNSPNNPTGAIIKDQLMTDLVTLCKKHHIYILIDEIYKGISDEYESISAIYELGIATNSLSKIYSFAGIRLGWIKANKEIINLINIRRDYSLISTGAFNDYIGTVSVQNKEKILQRSKEIVSTNKTILKKWLEKEEHVHCVIPTDGTVCFLGYDLDIDSKQLCIKLQKETGVFFVPGEAFGCNHHLRFGFTQNPKDVKKGLEIFSNYIKEHF